LKENYSCSQENSRFNANALLANDDDDDDDDATINNV
jgi:hypothetical protein